MIPAQLYTNASSRLGACLDFQAQTAQTAAKVQPDPQRCRSSRSLDALSRNRHCSPTHNISSTSTCSTADRLQKPSKTKPTHTELQGPTHNISSTTVAGTHHSSQWNPLSPLMPHTAYPPPPRQPCAPPRPTAQTASPRVPLRHHHQTPHTAYPPSPCLCPSGGTASLPTIAESRISPLSSTRSPPSNASTCPTLP